MTAPLVIAMPGNEAMAQKLGRMLGFDGGEVAICNWPLVLPF